MTRRFTSRLVLGAALATSAAMGFVAPAQATRFKVTNLVSDGSVPAAVTDPNLINPWGIASSPQGAFWVNDNGTGLSTLYKTDGSIVPLVVSVGPPAGGTGSAPTGMVFNGTSGFTVSQGGKTGASPFIFSTEDGTISGWSPGVNVTNSIVTVDNSGSGAVYKGLAIGATSGASFIYASNFNSGLIEQYDSNYKLVRAFTDPGVAPGYAPFGIQVINGHLFVSYALQNAQKHDDVGGAGHGYVDEFTLDGQLVRRIVSKGGEVNSPWALTIAPSSFGQFAGSLLVGNFGDGTISAYRLSDDKFLGQLDLINGQPLVLGDLWGLIQGNGGAGGDKNKLYFTAGVQDEAHGLFGSISAVPEPGTPALLAAGLAGVATLRRRTMRR